MDPSTVLFLGGGSKLASVQIRCMQIADGLGCEYRLGRVNVASLPARFSTFVCVKAGLRPRQLQRLASRGVVVWDIIDAPPPARHVAVYLASTAQARDRFAGLGRIEVIPHHHCNRDGRPNDPQLRRAAWIGSPEWYPAGLRFDHDAHFSGRMSRSEVVASYQQAGIGLNLRSQTPTWPEGARSHRDLAFHVAVNSGIKLINCIGFGIPSISDHEPAYHEIGEDCTLFAEPGDYARRLRELQTTPDLYARLRDNCVKRAAHFHLDTILARYRTLLAELCVRPGPRTH